jgi:hypothetical protein
MIKVQYGKIGDKSRFYCSLPPPGRGRIEVGVEYQAFHPHPNFPPSRVKGIFFFLPLASNCIWLSK